MKFEEVLPALLEGKKIRKIYWGKNKYVYSIKGESSFIDQDGYTFVFRVDDFKEDVWEIINEPKKVKLRDLTLKQYNKWRYKNCNKYDCYKNCPFRALNCIDACWMSDKNMFSDKFLDQEVEIEEE